MLAKLEQYASMLYSKIKPAEEDEDAQELRQQSLMGDIAANIGMVLVVAIVLSVFFLFLAGVSMRGLTKIIEGNACRDGRMPSPWSYLLWNIINNMTFGLVGIGGAFKSDPWKDCHGVQPERQGLMGQMTRNGFQQMMRIKNMA